ncbi:diguanylate cyclase [Sphingomonas bacterium]|uniref:GGDEF domain-containing protein n=1 Tax=Sphingomonas bacterium TaxID=1895847 RepID=UPI0015764AD4|nr:GGDEF domain-containing protein [Sphingomonas bacterium]
MRERGAARQSVRGDDLFEQIGAFLGAQGLSPEPAHYGFAFAALADPDTPIARRVAELTDGGVRLNRKDIERLGHQVLEGGAPLAPRDPRPSADSQAEQLVAETRATVDGFSTMMRTITNETRDFGADLAASAAAIERASPIAGIDEIARITTMMMNRVRDAERRLARADEETEALRAKLAEAHQTARIDALTGLANRRAFDEAFVARDAVAGPWCVVVVDIDRFKQVNDDNGHAVGDRVLAAIARLLADCFPGQIVARHGGEEFAILIGGVGLAEAARQVDAARQAVSVKRFRTRDTDQRLGRITLSAGVTAVQPGDDGERAMARADRLLYAAKAGGRDQVCAA